MSSNGNEIAKHVGVAASAGLPLAAGLRALSEEVRAGPLQDALCEISQRLESGESEQDVFQQRGGELPDDFRTLVGAGVRTGQLGTILEQYLQYSLTSHELRRKLMVALGYPALLVFLATVLMACILLFIVGEFKQIFLDFGTELPGITTAMIALHDFVLVDGLYILFGILFVSLVVWWLFSLTGLQALRTRLLNAIPLFGPLFEASALAQFCRVLALLIEHEVPLPEALRIAGAGSRNANIQAGCHRLAAAVENGTSLEEAMTQTTEFPHGMADVFRWSHRGDAFPDLLHSAADIFASRASIQASVIGTVSEPVVIIGVAVTVGMVVIALFMPLIKLMNDLS